MRKKLFLFIMIMLAAAAVSVTAAAAAETAETSEKTVIIDACDTSDCFSGGQTDFAFKKEGFASVKHSGGNLWIISKFNSPDLSGIPAGSAYFEFWFYIEDTNSFDFTKDARIALNSSGDIDDSNEIRWHIKDVPLENGWNYVSFKFTDAVMQNDNGRLDYNALNFLRIHAFPKEGAGITSWIDRIRITNTPYVPDESELGLAQAGTNIPLEPDNETYRQAWLDYLESLLSTVENKARATDNTAELATVFITVNCVLFALASAAVVFFIIFKKRKGAKKV